jgi:hypothetical protein
VRRGGKPDAGDAELVTLARRLGATVTITSHVGFGFPDWVLGIRGATILVERKTRGGAYRTSQVQFYRRWTGGPIVKVETTDDLLGLLTAGDPAGWARDRDVRTTAEVTGRDRTP